MKKFIHLLSSALCLMAVMSFIPEARNVMGTYTVGVMDPSQIKLDLKYDHTFTYQDFSNPNNKIEVTGRWEEQGEFVILKDYVSSVNFHDKWKITADGKFAKAKQGITFFTLQRQGC